MPATDGVAENDCDRDWLEHTDAVLRGAGLRATAGRSAVVEHLARQRCLVTAQEIVDALRGDEHHSASTATVYRALEFLERLGFAHRIESLNAYVPCRLTGGHAAAFLICDCCGEAAEFAPDLGAQLAAAEATGYAVRAITIEARGLCAACRTG